MRPRIRLSARLDPLLSILEHRSAPTASQRLDESHPRGQLSPANGQGGALVGERGALGDHDVKIPHDAGFEIDENLLAVWLGGGIDSGLRSSRPSGRRVRRYTYGTRPFLDRTQHALGSESVPFDLSTVIALQNGDATAIMSRITAIAYPFCGAPGCHSFRDLCAPAGIASFFSDLVGPARPPGAGTNIRMPCAWTF